jgi:hypothetical protein
MEPARGTWGYLIRQIRLWWASVLLGWLLSSLPKDVSERTLIAFAAFTKAIADE